MNYNMADFRSSGAGTEVRSVRTNELQRVPSNAKNGDRTVRSVRTNELQQ